jgi:hypothetical protein
MHLIVADTTAATSSEEADFATVCTAIASKACSEEKRPLLVHGDDVGGSNARAHTASRELGGRQRDVLCSGEAISFTWGFSAAAVVPSNAGDVFAWDVFGRFFGGLPLGLAMDGVGFVAPSSTEARRGFTARGPIENVEATGQKDEWTRTNTISCCDDPRCMELSFELKCALAP